MHIPIEVCSLSMCVYRSGIILYILFYYLPFSLTSFIQDLTMSIHIAPLCFMCCVAFLPVYICLWHILFKYIKEHKHLLSILKLKFLGHLCFNSIILGLNFLPLKGLKRMYLFYLLFNSQICVSCFW